MPAPEKLLPVGESLLEMNRQAMTEHQANMDDGTLAWLAARGIDKAMVDTYRLGKGSAKVGEHERWIGYLAIPYLGMADEVLQIRWRCLGNHDCKELGHGKYESMPNEPARLYGVKNLSLARDVIHVTEGEIDKMILDKIGLPAVALGGADIFQARHARMLSGFSKVYIWADPDKAGGQMAAKVMRMVRQAVRVRLTDGDVNELYLAHGADHLKGLVE